MTFRKTSARCAVALLSLLSVATAAPVAHAQPAPVTPPATPAADSRQEDARSHFDVGLAHFDREEWQAALVEFLKSRELYPSKGNTKNAAICLRKVGRYDEALDMFEVLVRDFPDLSATDRALAQSEIATLQASVGTIEVRDAPAGASVSVDGVDRGKAPLKGPLRLSAGTHTIRVSTDGFLPFEARVDLAGRQAAVVNVQLKALTQAGTLHVVEHTGAAVDVLVDNSFVGKTPWEGALAPGPHTVILRGEGDLGSPPVATTVKVNEVVSIELVAVKLAGEIEIAPQPENASVAIDGVNVGRGKWKGRLKSGPHRAVIALAGYQTYTLDFALGDQLSNVDVELQPAVVAPKPRIAVELDPSFAIGLLWGGAYTTSTSVTSGTTTVDSCASCSAGVPVGAQGLVRATYVFPSRFGLGLHAGYMALFRTVSKRNEQLTPVGKAPEVAPVDDALRLAGFVVGGDASYVLGDDWPLTLRFGIGALIASIHDARTGTFVDSKGASFGVDTAQTGRTTYLYAAPEVRIGRRFGDHFTIDVGTQLLVAAALSTPSWQSTDIGAGQDGAGVFPERQLNGGILMALTPGLGARYEF